MVDQTRKERQTEPNGTMAFFRIFFSLSSKKQRAPRHPRTSRTPVAYPLSSYLHCRWRGAIGNAKFAGQIACLPPAGRRCAPRRPGVGRTAQLARDNKCARCRSNTNVGSERLAINPLTRRSRPAPHWALKINGRSAER